MIESLLIDGLELHDGVSYNITGTGPGFYGSPVPRSNRPERAQRDGQIDLTYFYGGRVIELEGIAIGTSPADALDKIDALKEAFRLNSGVANDFEEIGVNMGSPQHKLARKMVGRDYYEQVFCSQEGSFDSPFDIASRVQKWGVTLVASDPRWYQLHEDDEDTEPYGDNVVVDSSYLQVILEDGIADFVTAGGNTPAQPWLTIQGPFTGFVRVEKDDLVLPVESDQLDLDLADGNNVDIVTRTRLAIQNQTIRHDLVNREETDWFELPSSDEVSLVFSADGGADPGTVCRVRWQVARL